MKRLCLPKKKRLVSNRQFKYVLERNIRASNGLLRVYAAENDCGYPRLGVSVGKSFGPAVVRNRFKRLLRESFRRNQYDIPPEFDYLLMLSPEMSSKLKEPGEARKLLTEVKYNDIESSFLRLVERIADKYAKMKGKSTR